MQNNAFRLSDAARPPLPSRLLQRYEIMEMLSETLQSETFLLKSRETGKPLVAKLYQRPFASDSGELQILAQLDHPAIPRPIDGISTDDSFCVVREYVEGRPLDELDVPLSHELALDIAVQLCDVLTYLHEQTPPIIHRDVKPQNVILDSSNKVHLIDFGISRYFSESADRDTAFVGTDGYAPPEQYGFMQTDCRADIYSLGVLLCFMLTGKRDLAAAERTVSKELLRVLRKCAAFAPEDRYASADAAKKAIIGAVGIAKKRIRWLRVAAAVAVPVLIAAFFLFRGFIGQSDNGADMGGQAFALPHTENPPHDGSPPHDENRFNEIDSGSTAGTSETQDMENQQRSANVSATPASAEASPPAAEVSTVPRVLIQSGLEADAAVFREPLIERAAKASLGLDADATLSVDELLLVRALYIYSDQVFTSWRACNDYGEMNRFGPAPLRSGVPLISTLEDLDMMPNLREAMIYFQNIIDFEPIFRLRNLELIELSPANISDLSPFAELVHLRSVCLASAPFTDITPLLLLPNLKGLALFNNREFDPKPLREFTDLIHFSIDGEFWEYLPLNSPLAGVHLPGCDNDSLDFLAAYKPTLEDLVLSGENITGIEGIEEFTRLRRLDISYSHVTDLTPLLSLPYLNEVWVSPDMLGAVREIRDLVDIDFWFVH